MVALYTDFGLRDVYAGVLRGVVTAVSPEASVLDVTHGIPPGDLYAGAFALLSAVPHLPRGTIHVTVVDPGVGGERDVVAVRAGGHTFVAPDNGVVAPVVEALGGATDLRTVRNERLQRAQVSRTFHGRDIMGPVAAHLVRGIDFALVGPLREELAELPDFSPTVGADRVDGRVLHVDHFGNIVTNLLPRELGGGEWTLSLGGGSVSRWGETFSDVESGELVVYTGSVGFVEVAVRDGSAAERLSVGNGDPVVAERRSE